MNYIITQTDRADFTNTPQTKSVSISCNGTAKVINKPDWLGVEFVLRNFKADSDSDGKQNSYVINTFEKGADVAAVKALTYTPAEYDEINDWYLPSTDEFEHLVDNKALLVTYPLINNIYWTSTETSATNAVGCTIDKICIDHPKSDVLAVRPIRKFTYTEVDAPYSLGDDLGYGVVFYIDSGAKTIYIVSNDELPSAVWGHKNTVANANYTSSVTLSVHRNDRYLELESALELGLVEDKTVRTAIVVTQESSDTDSQNVFLKDIIDNVMIEASSPDSYLQGVQRYHILLLAKNLIKDITYDALREVRVYEAEITASNKVLPPIDYVEYIRLCLVTTNGKLLPLFINKDLNISSKYLKDNDEEIIVDDLGYPIKTQGTRAATSDTSSRIYYIGNLIDDGNFRYDNALYGMKGGQVSYTGSYRYDREAREFILDGIPSEFTHVVIEYMSDPIAAEKDPRKIRIHKYFRAALEAGIYWKFIQKMRNVPAVEKAQARKEYYEEMRKANMRMSGKPKEMIQKLGADIGFNKM